MFAFSSSLQRCFLSRVCLNIRNLHQEASHVTWKKPQYGWIKLNFDGSCKNNMISIGGVFRNHKAEFIMAYAESIGRGTSTFAESAALKRGLEVAEEYGIEKLWIESDSKSLVDVIVLQRKVRNEEMQIIVNEIKVKIADRKNYRVSHIYREGNRAADMFAGLGHEFENPKIWISDPPTQVMLILNEDATGKSVLRNR